MNIFKKGVLALVLSAGIMTTIPASTHELRLSEVKPLPKIVKHSEKDIECLAQNIYHEAGNEPVEGKVAVAQVVINRVKDSRYPKSICNVIKQRNLVKGKVICQFSWQCESKKPIPVHSRNYKQSEHVAKSILNGNMKNPLLTKALYFHDASINPRWKKVTKIAQIGNNVFYREH